MRCTALWAVAAILVVSMTVASAAAETTIKTIPAVPGAAPDEGTPSALELATFEVTGVVDRLESDEIVVDDKLLYLAGDVGYYSSNGDRTAKSAFKAGNQVGCVLDADGKVKELWFIKE
jgi:hypothetical protein